MISLEKLYILTPLQKMPKNLGDLSKFIVAKGYKKLPKVQKIAQSGHTASDVRKDWSANFVTNISPILTLLSKASYKSQRFALV